MIQAFAIHFDSNVMDGGLQIEDLSKGVAYFQSSSIEGQKLGPYQLYVRSHNST